MDTHYNDTVCARNWHWISKGWSKFKISYPQHITQFWACIGYLRSVLTPVHWSLHLPISKKGTLFTFLQVIQAWINQLLLRAAHDNFQITAIDIDENQYQ